MVLAALITSSLMADPPYHPVIACCISEAPLGKRALTLLGLWCLLLCLHHSSFICLPVARNYSKFLIDLGAWLWFIAMVSQASTPAAEVSRMGLSRLLGRRGTCVNTTGLWKQLPPSQGKSPFPFSKVGASDRPQG